MSDLSSTKLSSIVPKLHGILTVNNTDASLLENLEVMWSQVSVKYELEDMLFIKLDREKYYY